MVTLRLLCLALPLVAWAEVNRSWETLQQSVKVGKKVVVTRMNSAKVEGKLLDIDAAQVSVRVKGQPFKVERADVFRLRYADIRKRNTFIGMAAGAAVFGLSAASPAQDYPELAGVAVAIGTGLGAAVGGAMPIGKPLYESATRPRKP